MAAELPADALILARAALLAAGVLGGGFADRLRVPGLLQPGTGAHGATRLEDGDVVWVAMPRVDDASARLVSWARGENDEGRR